MPQKTVEEQALVDFLADHPIAIDWELSEEQPDKDVLYVEVRQPWKIYFNEAAQCTKMVSYFQAHTIYLISKANPVEYIMSKLVLSDQLVRWSLLL